MVDTIGCHQIVNSFYRNAHHVHWSVFVSVSETAGWLCFVLAVRDPCGLDYWIIGQKKLEIAIQLLDAKATRRCTLVSQQQ